MGFLKLISFVNHLFSVFGFWQDGAVCFAFVPLRKTEHKVWSRRSVHCPLKYTVVTEMKTALSCRGPGLNTLCLRWCYYYPCVMGEGTEVGGGLADVNQSGHGDSHNL